MDPIETWHDAPTFETMERRIKDRYAALVEAVLVHLILFKNEHRSIDEWESVKDIEKALAELK